MRDLDLKTLRLGVICSMRQYNVRTKHRTPHTERPLP
jgi:hypothetical protein